MGSIFYNIYKAEKLDKEAETFLKSFLPEDRSMTDLSMLFTEFKRECKEEGKEEGLVEGEAKGRAEGKAEGLAEGLAKGEAKKSKEFLQNLKKDIFTILSKKGFDLKKYKKDMGVKNMV